MRRGTEANEEETGGSGAKAAITLSEESPLWKSMQACITANTTRANEPCVKDVGRTNEACADGIVLQQS